MSFAANVVGTEALSRVTVERVIIASEAPSVSTIVSPGIRSSSACLLAALKAIPDDTMARSDDRSSARDILVVEGLDERAGKGLADDAHHRHVLASDQPPQLRRVEALVVTQHDGAATVQCGSGHAERGCVHER